MAIKEEFLILQLDKDCYFVRKVGAQHFSSVGNPLLATRLGDAADKDLLLKEVLMFKDAKFVRLKVSYEIEDL